jgi:hypothetical protein
MLRNLKHPNVVTLIDVLCKVETSTNKTGIFNWFQSIEDEPIVWLDEDGTESQQQVQLLKWYLVFEYCPASLQTLIENHGALSEKYACR